jgi:osomolarity two-component system response regulator SKN7
MLENKAFKDTFCWGPDGTTFIVKDTNEFSKTILPKHFKHCNFASFVRQLNKYDFHKVRNAEDGQKQTYGDQVRNHVVPENGSTQRFKIVLGICSSQIHPRSQRLA